MIDFDAFRARYTKFGSRVLIQTVIGRSGSLFLQSLFDGHQEILMFPGVVNFFTEVMPQHKSKPKEWESIISKSIHQWMDILEEYNIYKNLGEQNNETIDVDVNKILLTMKIDCGVDESTSFGNLFIAFHYSCGKVFGHDMSKVKCIYVHEHTENFGKENLKVVKQVFDNTEVICILRDPRGNHLSIVNWMKKAFANDDEFWKAAKFEQSYSDNSWVNYKRILSIIAESADSYFVVRLEDIHTHRDKYLKLLCSTLSLCFDEKILLSTFNGKQWGGDNFSTNIKGFRTKNTFNKWRGGLSIYWQLFYEVTMSQELKALNYDFFYSKHWFSKSIVILLFPFWFLKDLEKIANFSFYKNRKFVQIPFVIIKEVIIFLKRRIKLFSIMLKTKKVSLTEVLVLLQDTKDNR